MLKLFALVRSRRAHSAMRVFALSLTGALVFPGLVLTIHAQNTEPAAVNAEAAQPEGLGFPAVANTLGTIPDSDILSPQCQNNSTTFRDVQFNVTGTTGHVGGIGVSFSAAHNFLQDLEVTLKAPTGQSLLLFSATGTTTTVPNSCSGSSNDLIAANTYTFADSAALNWWATAASSNPVPSSVSRTVTSGIGGAPNVQATSLDSAFRGALPNGIWTLRFRDRGAGDLGAVSAATLFMTTTLSRAAVLDFDGDGRTDDAVTRPVAPNLLWYIQRSTQGFTGLAWGTPSDIPVPEDYDNDGKWDVAVWRAGNFYILRSGSGTFQAVQFGQSGDDPRITQDYDGDGLADPSVTRNVGANIIFYSLRSSAGFSATQFGQSANDIPLRGDYDGDGKADIVVYRNQNGSPANTYFVLRSLSGTVVSQPFGNFTTDYVFPADFDGDGKTDFAVWRGLAAGGAWYWIRSSDNVLNGVAFGTPNSDRPVVGDYDGDGRSDQAVYPPGNQSYFYHLNSSLGFSAAQFGAIDDSALAFYLQAR